MEYRQLTDEALSFEVHKALDPRANKLEGPSHDQRVISEGGHFLGHFTNYCDRTENTFDLLYENEMFLHPLNNPMYPDCWEARENRCEGVSAIDENPLRAICVCFLKIKQAKAA